jgi:hypothetical protein
LSIYLKHDVSGTGFYLCLQVGPIETGASNARNGAAVPLGPVASNSLEATETEIYIYHRRGRDDACNDVQHFLFVARSGVTALGVGRSVFIIEGSLTDDLREKYVERDRNVV